MKKHLKRISIIFLVIFAIVGGLKEFPVSAADIGDLLVKAEDGWTRYDDTDSNIVYDNNWSGIVRNEYNKYNGGYHENNASTMKVGAKIKFKFYGTKLRILTWMWSDNSGANVKIDGVDCGNYATYSKEPYGGSRLFFEKTDLTKSEHIVEITTLDKDVVAPEATNNKFALDAIDVDSDGELRPYTEEESKNRAILTITMSNNAVKKYDLSLEEVNKFLDWYKSEGKDSNYYVFENKPLGNTVSSKTYIPYSKIEFFDVEEYKVN